MHANAVRTRGRICMHTIVYASICVTTIQILWNFAGILGYRNVERGNSLEIGSNYSGSNARE